MRSIAINSDSVQLHAITLMLDLQRKIQFGPICWVGMQTATLRIRYKVGNIANETREALSTTICNTFAAVESQTRTLSRTDLLTRAPPQGLPCHTPSHRPARPCWGLLEPRPPGSILSGTDRRNRPRRVGGIKMNHACMTSL